MNYTMYNLRLEKKNFNRIIRDLNLIKFIFNEKRHGVARSFLTSVWGRISDLVPEKYVLSANTRRDKFSQLI